MPTPLQLNDDEMSVLLSLAGPIDQQRRPQFLQEVAQELEASGQAGGPGVVHRVGRVNGGFPIRRCSAKASIGALRSLFA